MGAACPSCEHPSRDPLPRVTGEDYYTIKICSGSQKKNWYSMFHHLYFQHFHLRLLYALVLASQKIPVLNSIIVCMI